jgi:CcmD family protein
MMAVSLIGNLLDAGTPDTSGYMYAGYVVIFTVMLVYLGSLIVRQRNLEQDYDTLAELEQSGNTEDEPLSTKKVGTAENE